MKVSAKIIFVGILLVRPKVTIKITINNIKKK